MDMKELQMIANVCQEFDLICIADEVYEWLVYPPHKHFKIGMYIIGARPFIDFVV